MAKKKDDNMMLVVVAGFAVVAYYMKNQNKSSGPAYNPTANYINEIGVAPAPNTPAWANWIAAAIDIYGAVDDLWLEGGPFYQNNVTQADVQSTADLWDLGYNPFDGSGGDESTNPNTGGNGGGFNPYDFT